MNTLDKYWMKECPRRQHWGRYTVRVQGYGDIIDCLIIFVYPKCVISLNWGSCHLE